MNNKQKRKENNEIVLAEIQPSANKIISRTIRKLNRLVKHSRNVRTRARAVNIELQKMMF